MKKTYEIPEIFIENITLYEQIAALGVSGDYTGEGGDSGDFGDIFG